MRVLAYHGTEFTDPLRRELIKKGRQITTVVEPQSIEDLSGGRLLSWGMYVGVYSFRAIELEGRTDVPVWLVEIEEALPPDGVYYHTVVVDLQPTADDLVALATRRNDLEPNQII